MTVDQIQDHYQSSSFGLVRAHLAGNFELWTVITGHHKFTFEAHIDGDTLLYKDLSVMTVQALDILLER